MKARQAKKIWCRRLDRYSPYWWYQVWNYVTKTNRDHRVEKAKRMVMKKIQTSKNENL